MIRPVIRPGGSGRRRLRALQVVIAVTAVALPAAVGVSQASAASFTPFTSNPLASIQPAATLEPSDSTTTGGNDYSAFGQYGEVARFGGFDTCWYDGGTYGYVNGTTYDGAGAPADGSDCTTGETKPVNGEFIDPQGFAVDPDDSSIPTAVGNTDAIYVLDRTSDTYDDVSRAETFRIQKLDTAGQVLGITDFTLNDTTNNQQVVGLTVDHDAGLLFATVDQVDPVSGEDIPEEVVAWSTTPNTAGVPAGSPGVLEGASGLPGGTDTSGLFTAAGYDTSDFSRPGVLTTSAQFAADPNGQIYEPQGLALANIDGTETLVIEGATTSDVDLDGYGNQPVGPVVVQPISLSTGALAASDWTTTSLTGLTNAATVANNGYAEDAIGPAGIVGNPDGSLTVLLDAGNSEQDAGESYQPGSDNVDVVRLDATQSASFGDSSATILASTVNSEGQNIHSLGLDGAAIATNGALPPFSTAYYGTLAAGPQITPLSNGLYAAVFGGHSSSSFGDQENPVSGGTIAPFWSSDASTATNPAPGNEGIRLLNPAADGGLLSNDSYPVSSIYDTLGGTGSTTSSCSIGYAGTSLAAGANGSVFVLDQGKDTAYEFDGGWGFGRQIVELAPTAGADAQTQAGSEDSQPGLCGTASGTFSVENTSASSPSYQEASDATPLTVKVGDTVEFNADTIDYPTAGIGSTSPTAAPYQLTWNPGVPGDTPIVNTMASLLHPPQGVDPGQWPSSAATYQYDAPGTYEATLTLVGDYGTYTEQGEVIVDSSSPPTAALSAASTTGTVNQPVSFDASGSAPGPGATIQDVHWNFGDGSAPVDASTAGQLTHTYSTAGTYTVTVTVQDNDEQQSSPATETVTINPAGTVANNPPPTTTQTTTPPPPTKTTTPPPVVKITPPVDVLKPGVTSAALVLQVKSVKIGTKLTVKLTESKLSKSAKAKVKSGSVKVGANNLLRFSTGKLPVGVTTIRFYETVGKGKKAKLVLVKTETVHVTAKKKGNK